MVVTLAGRRVWAYLALMAASSMLACTGGAPSVRATRRLDLASCRLEGLPEEVRCGTLRVPEDRRSPGGRQIDLFVAVIPALSATPARDPLFVLAGGPGQAASGFAPWAASVFRKVRRERDLVLLDQRGTGRSHSLDCERRNSRSLAPITPAEVRTCLAALDADPRLYAHDSAVVDLDAVREALGYEQVNLWGGSYGTRAALVYLRQHPSRVRAAVLDGAAPFSVRFPLYTAREGQRALDLLFEDCERDAECRTAYPDLRRTTAEVLQDLERQPARVSVRDPRTGAVREETISRDDLAASLRGFLYVPSHASLVPWILERAAAQDFEPFLALHQTVNGWSFDTMSLGMTLSVLCSEDVPRIEQAEISPSTQATFLGTSEIERWQRLCTEWPRASLPAGFFDPVRSDVPVLVFSGGIDPATPPRWGDEVTALFPRGRHAVVRSAGHNVSPWGCAPALMAEFFRRGTAEALDTTCLDRIRRPPFVLPLPEAGV